jgi:elongation factor P--(R)-beta-lysine ligase
MHYSRQTAIQKNLVLRSKVIQAIRTCFTCAGYLEVETPVRIPAPAPEAHIDAQESGSWFLQTSPELCMKRLMASGFEKIFQICKCFREKERGAFHIPELTMLEWYRANATYLDLMTECENMLSEVISSVQPDPSIHFKNQKTDMHPPWDRLRVADAFLKYGSVPIEKALAENRFDEIMGIEIEPCLGYGKPVFLYDYPSSCAALARRKPFQPELAERFELYINGIELCNCFTELTDPVEQRDRFEKELESRRIMDKKVYPMPERFLKALANMPPAAGNALGLDRLIMLLANAEKIDDIVTFTPEEL